MAYFQSQYFTTNATVHTHHTRQINIPQSPYYSNIWHHFRKISYTQRTKNLVRNTTDNRTRSSSQKSKKKRLHCQVQLSVLIILPAQLLQTITVLCEYQCHAWMWGDGGGVCRPAGWVCLGGTRMFVCWLPVLMSCMRSCPGWWRPVFARCASPRQ